LPKKTSGIGGNWNKAAAKDVDSHKPATGSWGVFERPADISKAYGGGRQIGVGGYQPSEEELAAKRAETEKMLREYRKGQGAEKEIQDAHEAEILEARKEASQLMRFGATKAALEELDKVKPWLCANTDLGSEILLEWAMAAVADVDTDSNDAKPVLKIIVSKAPKPRVKKAAQQLMFQDQAVEFLKFDDGGATDEWAKIARGGLKGSLNVANDRRYDIAGAYLSSEKRPPVSSIAEARTVLRSAAVRRDDGGAGMRINQALTFISTLPVASRLPNAKGAAGGSTSTSTSDGGDMSSLLRGEWLLGFATRGTSLSFAPLDAALTLRSDGAYESLEPAGLGGLVKSVGSFVVARGAKDEVSLELNVESQSLGPLPLPVFGGGSTLKVFLLDSIMCIMQTGSGYSIYVRPSMQSVGSQAFDEE